MGSRSLTIDPRFCGPPDTANGGYAAGVTATALAPAAAAVEATLRAPTPLGRELQLSWNEDGAELSDGERVLIRARPCELDVPLREPPSRSAAIARQGSCRALRTHPFPRCFVCGPDREPGDGLRILPGWHPELGLAAASWTPAPDLADADGRVRPEILWAALDSTSSFPLLEDPAAQKLEPLVLGRIAVALLEPVRAGEPCLLATWSLGLDGARGTSACVIHTERGPAAVARATWVSLAGR